MKEKKRENLSFIQSQLQIAHIYVWSGENGFEISALRKSSNCIDLKCTCHKYI